MSVQAGDLAGPNLKAGILESGWTTPKLLGHADGEPVLLIRSGTSMFAVSSSCTHYGGPLQDGIVAGETVHCPWHHACFDLRTGAPHAPALNPIAVWNVERAGDRIRVTGKKAIPPAAPKATAVRQVVIVGGGAAGNAAADRLRAGGFEGSITMLSADADLPYDRPNISKDYLAGTAPEEWIPLRPAEYFVDQRIDTRVKTEVTAIDPAARLVHLANGEKIPYDALLLCTGATPVRLPLPGADLAHVHYLRSLADSRALIAAAGSAKSVAVIGASFIGLEVAASLRARKLEVHVIGMETKPLEKVLGAEAGDFVRRLHEENGVVFHLGRKPQSIEPGRVVLDDGSSVAADLVVIGVGVRPNTNLAEKAGLTVNNGVVVDEHLETSHPGIYAAGDIARWPYHGETVRIEHWVVAEHHGEHFARTVLGDRRPYTKVPFFWSMHYGVQINYTGYGVGTTSTTIQGDTKSQDWAIGYWKDGKVVAVASVGRDALNLEAEQALLRDDQAALRKLVG
jgi:NADPH-dependent 2,4-dienoyl-CoA reductase/sulfur reductase-like enzyme/nitrite reductase/ring-hydroxylating ferredoxin subunit